VVDDMKDFILIVDTCYRIMDVSGGKRIIDRTQTLCDIFKIIEGGQCLGLKSIDAMIDLVPVYTFLQNRCQYCQTQLFYYVIFINRKTYIN